MARVQLDIRDLAHALTLQTMLESGGHEVVETGPDVMVVDNAQRAVQQSGEVPVVVLTPISEIAEAVRAMRQGVFGYIVVPLVPGEALIMVERAVSGVAAEQRGPKLESLRELEDRHILHVLRACKYKHGEAANVLGIGRNTLWRRLKRMGKTRGD